MSSNAAKKKDVAPPRSAGATPRYEVAIIGAGFAGLCLAYRLKQAGITDFVVLERAAEVGGVWRDNTYPGCACDVPSHLYSLSFAPKSDWSRMYPTQAELKQYLNDVARDYGLEPHIRFGTELTRAEFDPADGLWTLRMRDGSTLHARTLASGAGGLNKPAFPEIAGSERFRGQTFHTSQWRHDLDLSGKRVAVIGTGASAIQVVPEVAKHAAQLFVYQRTPPWVMPKFDPPISPAWQQRFAKLPFTRRTFRTFLYWLHEMAALNFLRPKEQPGSTQTRAVQYLASAVRDPELRQRLTPNYKVGCKRILLSNDYLPSFNRDNVELVSEGIAELTASGIVTRDGRSREVDVIIFATGFKATEFVAPLEICGLDGRELAKDWQVAAPSYLGIVTAGYPNFFMLMGPNTALGHNSVVFMIEAQVNYIVQCVQRLRRDQLRYLDVRREVQDRFQAEVQSRMQSTVWLSGCKSWYISADGKSYTLWPDFTFRYWQRARKLKREDFEWVAAAQDHGRGRAAASKPTANAVDA